MAIRLKCRCGKVLSVRDELQGKAVKCPGCGKVVRVPAGATAKAGQATKGSRPAAKPAAAASGGGGSESLDDLFAEEGFNREVAAVCPACGKEMKAGAVLCTKCGYNKQTGERLSAHQAASDIDMGTLALMKAERDMKEDRDVQDRMLGKSGLPWWMLGLILFMLVSAVGILTLVVNASNRVDEQVEFNPMATFLLLTAGGFYLVALGANLMLIVKAFQNSVLDGLLCLFIPLYQLYFCFKHWAATWRLLATSIVAGSIGVGFALAATAAMQGG